MADRPKMPVPTNEMSPAELVRTIKKWAEGEGYVFSSGKHATEYAIVRVRDSMGNLTWTTIPIAHRGRRLKKYQIRYVIQQLNARWSN